MKVTSLFTLGIFALLISALVQFGGATYIHLKAIAAQFLLEQAWSKTSKQQINAKPWPWADTWPIARLTVPKLRKSFIVLSGASGRNLAFGPAHLSASAKPGTFGTIIIAGHRDTHFKFLENLSAGDFLEMESYDAKQTNYQVKNMEVLNTEKDHLYIEPESDQLILVTCYPFDELESGGPLRYVVTLTPSHIDSHTLASQRQLAMNKRKMI